MRGAVAAATREPQPASSIGRPENPACAGEDSGSDAAATAPLGSLRAPNSGEQAALWGSPQASPLPVTLRPVIPPFSDEKAEPRRERLLPSPRALELNNTGPRHQPQRV